jgi:para-nitrobenzyl esterase
MKPTAHGKKRGIDTFVEKAHAILRTAIFLLLGVSASAWATYNQSLTRSLDSGQIYGKVDSNNTHAFLGIPYAQPPVGNLRWKASLPPTAWSGSRAATSMAPMCAQVGSYFGEPDAATFGLPVGSEDCLYLNVWRPNSNADNLPVIFWIHGGGNINGTIRDFKYNGAYLANKANMVVVTVQYRLGMLGYLSHPALKTGTANDNSGNFAMLDLIRALDWVQSNITAFGGNRNQVTVAGQSAGCFNTWGLLQSPLATNKFHRALCMSGIPIALPPAVGTVVAETLVDNLLVDNGSASTLVDAAALRLTMNNAQISALLRNASAAKIMQYTPSPTVPGPFADGAVIRAGGLVDLAAGIYNRVPMMIGSVHDEGTYFAYALGMSKPTPQQYWALANSPSAGSVTYGDLIKPEFQAIFPPTHQAITSAIDNVTDNVIRTLWLTAPPDTFYRYNLNWDDTPSGWKQTFGAFHGMDVSMLFGVFVTDQPDFIRYAWNASNETTRRNLSDKYIKYVSTFARTGRPSQLFDGQTPWNPWTNVVCGFMCPKRMIFDNTSGMSGDEYLFFWTRYSLLTQQEKDFVWKAIDFNALPASIDPFRSGMH